MKRFKNYLGQLRLYSLADLVLLLIALNADTAQFIGVLILHIAFLAYLENKHSHPYRAKVPRWVAYLLAIVGIFIFRKIEGLIYLLFAFLYTKKIKNLGFMSPLFRGLQNLFIIAAIIGYQSPIAYVASGLLLLRNLAGDFRDLEKDKTERMKTIPILIGMNRNIKHIHLIFTIFTSTVWWYLSPLSILWLLLIIVIQVCTYNLTPR
ncbi:MAG: hypothetical protein V4664_04115 [Patescibacteria group bacterium]